MRVGWRQVPGGQSGAAPRLEPARCRVTATDGTAADAIGTESRTAHRRRQTPADAFDAVIKSKELFIIAIIKSKETAPATPVVRQESAPRPDVRRANPREQTRRRPSKKVIARVREEGEDIPLVLLISKRLVRVAKRLAGLSKRLASGGGASYVR